MKRTAISFFFLALILVIAGCEKDNYDEPTSFLKGNLVYNGNSIGVRSNALQLELWQPGYELYSKIPVYIAQDGSYSARLFDGDYKLVRLAGGPYEVNTDSIDVTVSGTTTLDVPVVPFFVITGESFNYSGGVVTSSCNVSQVSTQPVNVDNVTLFVGTNKILDNRYYEQRHILSSPDISQPVNHSITLDADMADRDYVFVRIGVKTQGVNEYLYTQVQKVEL